MIDQKYTDGLGPKGKNSEGGNDQTGNPARGLQLFGDGSRRLLAVNCARLIPHALLSSPERNVILTSYASIDHGFLQRVAPEIVAAPLFAEEFDILDLIQKLESCGYTGLVLAIAGPMPNAAAVETEIRGMCRAVTMSLAIISEPQGSDDAPPDGPARP